jgi:uncharacterized protein YjeT (DUF2065 family)
MKGCGVRGRRRSGAVHGEGNKATNMGDESRERDAVRPGGGPRGPVASAPPPSRRRAFVARLRDGEVGDPLRGDPWHWPLLIAWTALWFSAKAVRGGQSWHFSAQGAQLLWEGAGKHQLAGGLDLFANYPRLQSGPLTFALAEPITWLAPNNGLVAAELVMTVLGLVVLLAVERAAFAVRHDVPASRIRWTVLGGGMVLIPLWALTGVWYAHFDDVLALTFAALAVWAAAVRRPVLLGAAVALAVDSKPWAAAFLPLVFALPGPIWRRSGTRHSLDTQPRPGRNRRIALAVCLVLIVAAWMPFLMADPSSLNAAGFTISNVPDSALRALGINDPSTPTWDRPAQIAVGCVFGALAVWRRRWPAAILIGVCARIALEPNDYAYYFAGLILGALFWDLLGARRPQPMMTLAVTALVFALPSMGISPQFHGNIKLWTMIGATLAALFGPAARTAADVVAGRSADARRRIAFPRSAAVVPPSALGGLRDDLGGELGGHGLVAQVLPREHARAVRERP